MITENITIDEAAVEAEVEATAEAARVVIQHELDGLVTYAAALKTAVTIKHRYLAKYPDDVMSVEYGPIFDCVQITSQLDDFASLPVLLRMFREAGCCRTGHCKTLWAELEYWYYCGDNLRPFKLIVSPKDAPGAACLRVQVGTRTSPVYEVQCNGRAVVDVPEPATT